MLQKQLLPNTMDLFRASLESDTLTDDLRAGLIGEGLTFDTPFGRKKLLCADYAASGRALRQVETFVTDQVLPYHVSTPSETSFCGTVMTQMHGDARAEIARLTGADETCQVIFTGSDMAAGISRIVAGLDLAARVARGQRVVVITGPCERHAAIAPWRECGAAVIEIAEAPLGGPDLDALDDVLADVARADLVIGAFAAASGFTGLITDTDTVTRRLKAAGALAIWDYTVAAPSLPIHMGWGDAAKDAIVLSPQRLPAVRARRASWWCAAGLGGSASPGGTCTRAEAPTWSATSERPWCCW